MTNKITERIEQLENIIDDNLLCGDEEILAKAQAELKGINFTLEMMKEDENIISRENIIKVLKYLDKHWDKRATIKYVLKVYLETEKDLALEKLKSRLGEQK